MENQVLSLRNKSRLFVFNCTSNSVPSPSPSWYDKGDARHRHYVLGLFLLFLPLLVQANIFKKNKKNSSEVWSGLRTQKTNGQGNYNKVKLTALVKTIDTESFWN